MSHTEQRQAFARHIFLGEIDLQAQLAAKAADRLTRHDVHVDPPELWSAIQAILTAAGNVSKILWPPRSKYDARGAMLRELLAIDANNPLADRTIRNHFEHYDERIENWLSSTGSATYVDQIIGRLPGFFREFRQNAHRHYDPSTQTLAFRGESLDLRSILGALDEIRRKARSIIHL